MALTTQGRWSPDATLFFLRPVAHSPLLHQPTPHTACRPLQEPRFSSHWSLVWEALTQALVTAWVHLDIKTMKAKHGQGNILSHMLEASGTALYQQHFHMACPRFNKLASQTQRFWKGSGGVQPSPAKLALCGVILNQGKLFPSFSLMYLPWVKMQSLKTRVNLIIC